jgi:hypothetical protein
MMVLNLTLMLLAGSRLQNLRATYKVPVMPSSRPTDAIRAPLENGAMSVRSRKLPDRHA